MTWRDLRGDPKTPKESVRFLQQWLAMPLQRQDGWLRGMLIALTAIALATALVVTAYPHYWLYAEFGIYVLGAMGFTSLMVLLLRAFSPAGVLWFLVTVLVFNVWNLVVMFVSAWSGWWHDAQPGYHFVISAIIGSVPLVAGIGVLTRKLKRTS
jgi:hypothetical protein